MPRDEVEALYVMRDEKARRRHAQHTKVTEASNERKIAKLGEPKPGTYRKGTVTLAGRDHSKDDPT